MTWIYLEQCTYSQEPVEVSSQTYCWDTDPCALLKSNPIVERYYSNANRTESCHDSQSGTMSAPLTEPSGEEKSTSSQEDSLVPTSLHHQQCIGECLDLMAMPVGCGLKWQESLAKYDPVSHSWKTRQTSLFGGLEEFSETWPRWGIMHRGECWGLTRSAWITGETESGLLPTVTATDWKGGTVAIRKDRGDQRLDQWRDYVKIKYGLTYPHPTHSETRMGWPIGWSELKPLETPKFQQWLRLHGKS